MAASRAAIGECTTGQNHCATALGTISGDVGPRVAMTQDDVNRIIQQITADIRTPSPSVLVPPSDPAVAPTTLMRITFTRYDDGDATARFMLAGLGQIYIEGDVVLIDGRTMQPVADHKIAKDFSFGGIYGGIATIQDVEMGFARSVAEAIKPKA